MRNRTTTMKQTKRNYNKIMKLAKRLGLTMQRPGFVATKSGIEIDLTATAETKEAITYRIGQTILNQ